MFLFGRQPRPPALGRARAAALLASVVVATGASLAGCAPGQETRDAGPAPSVSVPASVSPLWPGYSAPPSTGRNDWSSAAPVPIRGFTVPAGGLQKVSVEKLLRADPSVSVKGMPTGCPGAKCRLRAPAYADLTGDGEPDLVVAFDDSGRTRLLVYTASGDTARRVLDYSGQPGLTAGVGGRELVIWETESDRKTTTRFRWDGKVLTVLPPDVPNAVRTP